MAVKIKTKTQEIWYEWNLRIGEFYPFVFNRRKGGFLVLPAQEDNTDILFS